MRYLFLPCCCFLAGWACSHGREIWRRHRQQSSCRHRSGPSRVNAESSRRPGAILTTGRCFWMRTVILPFALPTVVRLCSCLSFVRTPLDHLAIEIDFKYLEQSSASRNRSVFCPRADWFGLEPFWSSHWNSKRPSSAHFWRDSSLKHHLSSLWSSHLRFDALLGLCYLQSLAERLPNQSKVCWLGDQILLQRGCLAHWDCLDWSGHLDA